MPQRPAQPAVVQHENDQFPREAPGFTADINSLQNLWDAAHNQPGIPNYAALVIETKNPAGGTWWQRWSDVHTLPSTELDPIKVKVVCTPLPGTAVAPASAGNKGSAGKKTKADGRPAGKKQGAAPKRCGKKAASAEAETPVTYKGNGRDAGRTASDDGAWDEVELLEYFKDKFEKQDAKLDQIEAQMLDSDNNHQKVAVLARIQDRLAATQATIYEHGTAIAVAAVAAFAAADDEDAGCQETWAERTVCTADGVDDDEEVDDDDFVDDFS